MFNIEIERTIERLELVISIQSDEIIDCDELHRSLKIKKKFAKEDIKMFYQERIESCEGEIFDLIADIESHKHVIKLLKNKELSAGTLNSSIVAI